MNDAYKDIFKATPCSMNDEPGYYVRQVRPDGSIASEHWTDTLDDLTSLGLTVEVTDAADKKVHFVHP